MNEEKTVTISEETIDHIRLSLNSISDLAAELYRSVFGYTTFKGALDNERYQNEHAAAYFWMNDNFNLIQASVLAINTIAELTMEKIPEE